MLRSVNMDNENGKLTRVNPLKEDLKGLCKNSIEDNVVWNFMLRSVNMDSYNKPNFRRGNNRKYCYEEDLGGYYMKEKYYENKYSESEDTFGLFG